MRLKLNSVSNKMMKSKNTIDELSNLFNRNSKNKKLRNNLSGDNFNLFKDNNENINFLNMNNSIYDIKSIKNKTKKLKR